MDRKTIVITGATGGIGFATAKRLAELGHTLLLHGRSEEKLHQIQAELQLAPSASRIEYFCADLSDLAQVQTLAHQIAEKQGHIDVLINNAGVFKSSQPIVGHGRDLRFVVNTVAPYLLAKLLRPRMPADGRVVNLSSAAQSSVSWAAFAGEQPLGDGDAYAQSKLAITMWTAYLAQHAWKSGPNLIAVNPASFLGSQMVKDAYGVAGKDLGIGGDILLRAALSEDFAAASGRYYDNDHGRFAEPHRDALNPQLGEKLVAEMESMLRQALPD